MVKNIARPFPQTAKDPFASLQAQFGHLRNEDLQGLLDDTRFRFLLNRCLTLD